MRVLALIEALREGDPTVWVCTMASIVSRAHLDDSDAAFAAEAITYAAADPGLPYGVRRRLYEAATTRRLPANRAAVLIAPPADSGRSAALRAQELRELAADGSLPEPLRTHAAEVWASALRRPHA